MAKTAAAKDTTSVAAQRAGSYVHRKIGEVVFEQGDVVSALAEYRAALAIDIALAA